MAAQRRNKTKIKNSKKRKKTNRKRRRNTKKRKRSVQSTLTSHCKKLCPERIIIKSTFGGKRKIRREGEYIKEAAGQTLPPAKMIRSKVHIH